LEAGAALYCLHKNPWWQTSRGPLLDAGAFVVGLEYATGTMATVLGKPSASYFEAALEALDADPENAWMVGDDIDADIGGAAAHSRALSGVSRALRHRGRTGVLRLAPQPAPALRRPLRREGGDRQGARLRRRACVRLA